MVRQRTNVFSRLENESWSLNFLEFQQKFEIRTNYLKYLGVLSAVKNALNDKSEYTNDQLNAYEAILRYKFLKI